LHCNDNIKQFTKYFSDLAENAQLVVATPSFSINIANAQSEQFRAIAEQLHDDIDPYKHVTFDKLGEYPSLH